MTVGTLVTNFTNWDAVDDNGNPKLTQERFRQLINKNALWFVYLFIGKFTLVYIHSVCFNLSSFRIVSNLRVRYVRSILRQEIAYFDEISAGSVATKIATNVNMIHVGMGEKVGIALQGELNLDLLELLLTGCRNWSLDFVLRRRVFAAMEAHARRGYNCAHHTRDRWDHGDAGFED